MTPSAQRWRARPWLARLVRVVAYLAPLAVAIGTSVWLARQLPPPRGFWAAVGAWLLLSAFSTMILLIVDRFARRLLPMAALLQLSLAFPGEAPSRYRVARETGGTRQLQAEIDHAREHGLSDDRTEAAVTVLRLVAALSTHDAATRGHAERVRVFVDMIADEMDIEGEDLDRLRWAALLHDVGKIAVHPDVLNDPGQLTEDEWDLMHRHPLEGARITAPLRPWLGHWALAIEQHHERWDGGGYPYGLAGQDISLGARVVSVGDAFDVMTAARSYKEAMSAEEARAELAAEAGSQFDPEVVRAFLGIPLNRLRWAVGPFSWLANTSLGQPVQAIQGAGTFVAGVAAAVVAITSYGAPPTPAADPAPVDEEIAAGADEPSAAPSAVPSPSVVPSPAGTPTEEPAPPAPPVVPSPDPTAPPTPIDPTPDRPDDATDTMAVVGEVVTMDEDTTLSLDLLANDVAGPGGELTLVDVDAPVGALEWETAGVVTWRPPPDWWGPATIGYLVTDGTSRMSGEVSVTVRPVNDAPRPRDDIATVREDESQVIDLLGDDVDPDGDALRISGLDTTAVVTGTVTDNGDGTITYRPLPDANGVDTLVYEVSDGRLTAEATLDVVVVAVDDPPLVRPDTATVLEDQAVLVDVLANDAEVDGEALAVTAATVTGGTATIGSDDRVTVVPAADSVAPVTGTVEVTDGTTTVSGALTVTVTPVNDAPRITPGADVVVEEDAGATTIDGWATGIAPGPADEAGQVLAVDVVAADPGLFATQPSLDLATGDLSFAFGADIEGSTVVTITLTDDGGTANGGQDTTVVAAQLTATDVNDPPVAVDDTASLDEDGSVVLDVALDLLANDSDPEGAGLTLVGVDASTLTFGELTDLGGGLLEYVPDPHEYGTETFTYTVSDGSLTDIGTVTLTVVPTPDAPMAAADAYATTSLTPLSVGAANGVLRNDGDEDGDPLVVDTALTVPPPLLAGVLDLDADGSFVFTPLTTFVGTTSFTYTVTDGVLTDTATVTIDVAPAFTADRLYLTGEVLDATTSRLSPSAPAVTGTPPDWDGDGEPGLTIRSSGNKLDENDPTKFHDWALTVDEDLRLDGPVSVELTSVNEKFEEDDDDDDAQDVAVDYTVGLYECPPSGPCTLLGSTVDVHIDDWNPTGTWSTRTLPIGSVSETIEAGNTLRLRLLFGHKDVYIALTGDRPSSLEYTTTP